MNDTISFESSGRILLSFESCESLIDDDLDFADPLAFGTPILLDLRTKRFPDEIELCLDSVIDFIEELPKFYYKERTIQKC